MRTSPTMAPAGGGVTQELPDLLAASDPRTRDRILSAVGVARRDALPVKASAVARAAGHSETTESRIRSGERMSPTGRAAIAVYAHAAVENAAKEDARPLERAGYASAFINATLNAINMWPRLEALSTEELHAELRRAICDSETRANSRCNNLEVAYLGTGVLDMDALLEAHTQQAAASELIMAILQILAAR